MPKIPIIETGGVSPANRTQHGSFPQMFERLLGEADASASFVGGSTAPTIAFPVVEASRDSMTQIRVVMPRPRTVTGSRSGIINQPLPWV